MPRLAELLVPPSLAADQALRLRRFIFAATSYAIATAMVAVAWAFGVLPASTLLTIAAVFVANNAAMYWAIRAGFNLRFRDPSLTQYQILSAITVLMYIVFHMDSGRPIALFSCFIVFQFGVFRLAVREFVVVTLYTLAAYALVINLLMHLRPQAIQDVAGEWMSWIGLAGFLPCMNIVGGQINAMRRRMRESEARLRSLTEMSSDFYWASDAAHRITERSSAIREIGADSIFRRGAQVGQRRWEVPYLSPDAAGWAAHRAELDAHRPFRNFEFSRFAVDDSERHVSISGNPVFDAAGAFAGYRGVGTDTTARKRAEEELRRFRAAIDSSGDAIVLIDRTSLRYLDFNQTLCDQTGYTRQEILTMTPMQLFGADRENVERDYDAIIANPESSVSKHESEARRKDGSSYPIETHRHAMRTRDGWIIVASARDITERKLAETALRESAQQLRLMADNIPMMIAYWDVDYRCRFANKALAAYLGFSVDDVLGKHARELMGEEIFQDNKTYALQIQDGRRVTYQRKRILKNGDVRHLEVTLVPDFGEHGKVIGSFALTMDITEHKLAEERIRSVAHHDSLTGLPNRLLFNDRLDQAISLARRDTRQFALLYLDLDGFKPVNDTYGHTTGDELLKAVAARIRRLVRDSDTVARVGGDEFVVILRDIAARGEAHAIAGKITTALMTPFPIGPRDIVIGTSIGIAIYPADALDADALVKAADAAMYAVKQVRKMPSTS